MKHCILSAAFFIFSFSAFSQSKIAYLYGHDEYVREQQKMYCPPVQLLGDSALIISSAILMNIMPDKYAITFGLAQTAATPAQAGKLMNERVQKFRDRLKRMNIADSNIYVDFISQNKVYDFDLAAGKAIEKEAGFEIKKNITVAFEDERMIETMTEAAAELQVFDVIKVEYILNDHTPFYKQLFAEAVKQIKDRKDMYVMAAGMELLQKASLHTDNLIVIFPSTQYKQYTAYESGEVESNYNNRLVKKQMRKSSTAYYEGVSQNGFDKVLNNNKPGVPVQMALGVSFKYYLKK